MHCAGPLQQPGVVLVPRNNRPKKQKKQEPEPELKLDLIRIGSRRTEFKRGVEYTVQPTNGMNAEDGKTWVCPHCSQTIRPGVSHVTAWDAIRGIDTRRHFHTRCWAAFMGALL